MTRIGPEGSAEPWWQQYTDERKEPTFADISGVEQEEIETQLANKQGLPAPSAGLPDEKAIEDALGFTRHDLSPDETRYPYRGTARVDKHLLEQDRGDVADWNGRHDETGADFD
ncbi:hypothetical protein IH980_05550 [Patescibacteria group bacterium]|nr:hypothetical protein [Patescibacteria group bacterium]